MSELFKKAQKQLEEELPFVIYSKPNSDKITGIFQKEDALNFVKDYAETGFVFVSFKEDRAILIPENNSEIITENSKKVALESSEINASFTGKAKLDFQNLVQKGIDAIVSGKFKKLVLSRTEAVFLKESNPILLFQKLVSQYPTAFKYCFFHPKVGMWLGATPEQLLKVEKDILKTVALAGTQVFKEGEIIWENKEKEEQLFVTDFISDNLKEYVSEERKSEPYTFRAGNIVHIKTDIEAKLDDKKELKKVVQTLHPTPAVCGLPKKEAKDFIFENEGYDREFYAGFLGELNKDFAENLSQNSDLFVNLRCMKIEGDTANLYIGCGITKDSDPEKEFIETVNKSLTIKKVIL